MICFSLVPAFAQGPMTYRYISPNNDGVQDALEFPLSINDQRYVQAWSFVIEDEHGNVVRKIENKEQRPEMSGSNGIGNFFKNFWKLLTRVKEGIPLPSTLRWDGIMDSGETAPDGTYYFWISAEDDNGNVGTSQKYQFFVDNTHPEITISPPTGANAMIFSPDGDGNKDTFKITQSGSVEDLWTATIENSAGTIVRLIETRNAAPADFIWDGKGDNNTIVPDGVYSYTITSTDRAGNTSSARITNIIIDTDKPSINISIDINAFSPNGDGVRDAVQMTPSIPVTTGLITWRIAVNSRSGTTVRTYAGTDVPRVIAFDGKDETGKIIAEGDYQAVISAQYINGYAPVARSPFFTMDITPPEAQVRASGQIFSPVGDGNLDTVTFTQQASAETAWTGEIFALNAAGEPAGTAVRTFRFGATPDTTTVWDGRDDTGKLAVDGKYGYRLVSTDRAGNTGYSNIAAVELNTEKADLILQVNTTAFSPNGDNVKDTIIFTPIIKAATAVDQYSLKITDTSGAVVKTFTGRGRVPVSFTWNGIADPAEGASTGTRSPDGIYGAALEVTLINQQVSRSAAPNFEIDTEFPEIEISAPYLLFSPNGDGKRDTIQINQTSSKEDLWTAAISTGRTVVKNYHWNGTVENIIWDATDDSGNRVADGTYTYTVTAEDKAGNKTTQNISGIVVDARVPKAFLTAELPAFSPNGDGIKDTQKLSIVTSIPDGLASWSLAIKPEGGGSAIRTWNSSTSSTLPATVNWDGKNDAGAVTQGKVYAELNLEYVKGDVVTVATPVFLVNAKPPALNVRLSPKYFSPDNDGVDDELFIDLTAESASPFTDWSFEIYEPEGTSGNVFWRTGGKGKITERIIWDGRSLKGELVQAATDYPFTFTVTDDVGMTSVVRGYVPVDVLVIRDGDKLKIAVPSIIFRANAADFNGLDQAIVDKNTQVLRRVAEILNKFKDYKVQIEGHANNVSNTQREEETELIPLSQQRAEAVKQFLIRNGVDGSRLSTIGMGGTRPVAAWSDRENWWKNRRVEFILIK
ncbi:gliding motility-associated C-terminal domain-containing protein [Brucepastera parasyntrophica]|nr:FlgD immunoglobulin-like domain containing protein [Brucepastera parasyntrophica]ULQ60784.1 gliding motility-associated C-terminal domain-containing protein [Brucepastera parasyntrophica]